MRGDSLLLHALRSVGRLFEHARASAPEIPDSRWTATFTYAALVRQARRVAAATGACVVLGLCLLPAPDDAHAGNGGQASMPGGDTIVTFSLVPAPADAETASREIAALREQLGEAGERERALARMQARLLARAGAAPLLSNRLALQKQAAQVAIRRDASQARMASAKAALAEQNAAVAEQKAVRRANGAREEAAAPAIATAAPSPAASSIADPVAVAATPPPWLSTAPDEAAPRTIDQRLSPALALARQIGLRFVSGYRPGAIIAGTMNLSDHSRFPSEAIDLGGSASAMQRYALAVAQLPAVDTVIYSPVGVWKAGTGWKSISSPITRRDHFDHVHVDTF